MLGHVFPFSISVGESQSSDHGWHLTSRAIPPTVTAPPLSQSHGGVKTAADLAAEQAAARRIALPQNLELKGSLRSALQAYPDRPGNRW